MLAPVVSELVVDEFLVDELFKARELEFLSEGNCGSFLKATGVPFTFTKGTVVPFRHPPVSAAAGEWAFSGGSPAISPVWGAWGLVAAEIQLVLDVIVPTGFCEGNWSSFQGSAPSGVVLELQQVAGG